MPTDSGWLREQDAEDEGDAISEGNHFGVDPLAFGIFAQLRLAFSRAVVEEPSATDLAAALVNPTHKAASVTENDDVKTLVEMQLDVGAQAPDRVGLISDFDVARIWASA